MVCIVDILVMFVLYEFVKSVIDIENIEKSV